MNTKIKYTDEPLGEINIIRDFLPSPAELAFSEESVKVTISLSKKSVEFFKTEASKYHTDAAWVLMCMVIAIYNTYDTRCTLNCKCNIPCMYKV